MSRVAAPGRSRDRVLRRSALATVGAVGLGAMVLVPALGASAHDYVLSSTPAQGSTVTTALDEVSVTFSDLVLDLSGTGSSNVLEVTDASGRHFEDGCSTSDGPVLSTGVALGGAGDYTMTYQAVSADGHTVSDALSFVYQPPAGTVAAEGASERPTCDPSGGATDGAADGTETATATPDPEQTVVPGASAEPSAATTAAAADGDGTDLGLVIGIGIGIVVVALGAVAVVLVTSRRRPAGDDESDEGGGEPRP